MSYLQDILRFILLLLLQVLLLSKIPLFGITVPVVYIYFLIKIPKDKNPYYVVTMGFLLGFLIDAFLNTPGLNAAVTTIMAAFHKSCMSLFYNRDFPDNYVPSMRTSSKQFVSYTIFMVLLHLCLLFLLEAFSFSNIFNTLLRILISAAVAIPIILALDSIFYRKVGYERA